MTQPDLAFRSFDPMTSPGAHADLFDVTPSDPAGVSAMVQGLLLHQHWAGAYGQTLTPARIEESHLRPIEGMLDALLSHDASPLKVVRPPEKRLVGVCRHFALLGVAILRAREIPARARCGFGSYFNAGTFEDHWVVEYWHARRSRWQLFDTQLDKVQLAALKPDFNPLDVPRDRFIIAGQAWTDCRAGRADPSKFGIFDMRGLWFIGGNLIRDVAALTNQVMLPWDVWGMMSKYDKNEAVISQEDLAFLDHLAALTADPDTNEHELKQLMHEDERLRIPDQVTNAVAGRVDTL